MAKDLDINQSPVKISCNEIEIGLCSIDETGRLLISDIYCPSIFHYNLESPNKEEQPCMLCGGKRGVPTLLSTKKRFGQMVCVMAMRFEMYRGVVLPHLDNSMINAAGDAVTTALLGLICGGQDVS
jgi:hypothetical protein